MLHPKAPPRAVHSVEVGGAARHVLHVTEYARGAASVATPRLVHAVNETSDLVEDLRSWSFHPSLQIAPGGVSGR